MNVARTTRKSSQALLAFSITLAALGGSGAVTSAPHPYFTDSSELDDELLVSSDSAVVFVRDHSPNGNHVHTVKLKTDDCGLPASMTNGHVMLTQSALAGNAADDGQNLDDEDPLVEALTLMSRSLSTHPEIAIISDGLDKWCDNSSFAGEDISSEFATSWRPSILPRRRGQALRQDFVYIA